MGALVVLALAAGALVGRRSRPGPADGPSPAGAHAATHKWTCSMHPEIVMDRPGKCPKCGMDLIPISQGTGHQPPRQLVVSQDTARLMEIATAPVERRFITAEIRMVGKIDYDETRVKSITSWVAGRIDRLYVDYTGITVAEADHMVYIYSPQLLSAQAELIQAARSVSAMNADSSDLVRRSIEGTLKAARQKMRLLGLTEQQVGDIERTGEPTDHLTIYSPMGGVVIEKSATEGMYVETGTPIYRVADLSRLWVRLDAYESDMMWIRYGQEVVFAAEAYPGEIFRGTISFIDPMINERTRTYKLRLNVDNSDGRLKPEMFVRAVVRSQVAAAGRVMDPNLAGKWICPMHPDIVKDGPAPCDICGMDLVTAESLKLAGPAGPNEPPLVIPASAPLITGKRAVVYVRIPDVNEPTFEGREVLLGPRAGDYYIVNEGLAEGERVVTNGNFKIDSALQLRAAPSMMSAEMWGEPDAADGAEQTICPVMGGKIDKTVFTEYEGRKVYFCCPGCIAEFHKDPQKYLDKLPPFSGGQEVAP